MFSFMRRHLVAYIIGAAAAIALGFGVSYFVGLKGSTPAKVRSERIEAEKRDGSFIDSITGGEDAKASDEEDVNAGGASGTSDGKDDASDQSDEAATEGDGASAGSASGSSSAS